MATNAKIIEHLLAQMSAAGAVSTKKMFGEYGIYCDGKLVGVVCDDRLFIKPTAAGRAIIGDCEEGAPYPGAKPSLVVDEARWDDRVWLSKVVKATAEALPAPGPKARKAPAKTGSARR